MANIEQTCRFDRFQELIPRILRAEPQRFEIADGPVVEAGQNVPVFNILALAALNGWPMWRASLYLAEYARYIKATPFGHDFPVMRALLRHDEEKPVSDVVTFH